MVEILVINRFHAKPWRIFVILIIMRRYYSEERLSTKADITLAKFYRPKKNKIGNLILILTNRRIF